MGTGADRDFIVELFAGFGPVTVRRMFSGAGVFADGLMIALVVDSVIYLKADDSFIPLFEREGQAPFKYKSRDGQRTLTSYWRMPDRLYDDPEELAQWARGAHAVAIRAAARKRRPKQGEKPVRRLLQRNPKRPPRGRSRT